MCDCVEGHPIFSFPRIRHRQHTFCCAKITERIKGKDRIKPVIKVRFHGLNFVDQVKSTRFPFVANQRIAIFKEKGKSFAKNTYLACS